MSIQVGTGQEPRTNQTIVLEAHGFRKNFCCPRGQLLSGKRRSPDCHSCVLYGTHGGTKLAILHSIFRSPQSFRTVCFPSTESSSPGRAGPAHSGRAS